MFPDPQSSPCYSDRAAHDAKIDARQTEPTPHAIETQLINPQIGPQVPKSGSHDTEARPRPAEGSILHTEQRPRDEERLPHEAETLIISDLRRFLQFDGKTRKIGKLIRAENAKEVTQGMGAEETISDPDQKSACQIFHYRPSADTEGLGKARFQPLARLTTPASSYAISSTSPGCKSVPPSRTVIFTALIGSAFLYSSDGTNS